MATPPYFICINDDAQINSTDFIGIRNHCSSQNKSCQNIGTAEQLAYFTSICRSPQRGSITGCDNASFSDFRGASMLTACIRGVPTTYSSYNNCTNGCVRICVQANTVNTVCDGSSRCYAYSKNNGSTYGLSTSNTCNFTGLGSGNYNIIVRDCTGHPNSITTAFVKARTKVGNGGSQKVCTCVQKSTSTTVIN